MSTPLENHSPLPKRLNFARKKAGVSQKMLGIMAGIDEFSSSARMNQYEKGKHAPDYAMVKRLAAVLNVPTSYFFEENDEIADLLMLYYRLSDAEKKQVLAKVIALQA